MENDCENDWAGAIAVQGLFPLRNMVVIRLASIHCTQSGTLILRIECQNARMCVATARAVGISSLNPSEEVCALSLPSK